jgi:hypothetical protein
MHIWSTGSFYIKVYLWVFTAVLVHFLLFMLSLFQILHFCHRVPFSLSLLFLCNTLWNSWYGLDSWWVEDTQLMWVIWISVLNLTVYANASGNESRRDKIPLLRPCIFCETNFYQVTLICVNITHKADFERLELWKA